MIINIQCPSRYLIPRNRIRDEITKVLDARLKRQAEVSILIAGDRQLKKLNTKYRKIPDTTDVLSFPQNDPSQQMKPFVMPPDDTLYLGDIVVSYPQAIKEASEENMMVDDKMVQLILHGLDHLMGIHHPE